MRRKVITVLTLIPVGACIGYVCCFLIARGYLVVEYILYGYWRDPEESEELHANALTLALYGGLIGSLLTPAVYYVWLRHVRTEELIKLFSLIAVVTVIFGVVGGLWGPLMAALLTGVGFLGACAGVSAYVKGIPNNLTD